MTIEKYGRRFWAVYDNESLICVTVYKKGAQEVVRILTEITSEQHSRDEGEKDKKAHETVLL